MAKLTHRMHALQSNFSVLRCIEEEICSGPSTFNFLVAKIYYMLILILPIKDITLKKTIGKQVKN